MKVGEWQARREGAEGHVMRATAATAPLLVSSLNAIDMRMRDSKLCSTPSALRMLLGRRV